MEFGLNLPPLRMFDDMSDKVQKKVMSRTVCVCVCVPMLNMEKKCDIAFEYNNRQRIDMAGAR